MIAKIWKRVLFIILVIACLFNIINKFVKKVPFIEELKDSAVYTVTQQEKETK